MVFVESYVGEPLNILHTVGFDILYPVVRCQISFGQLLDRQRFEGALDAVCQVVPQLKCRYQMKTNRWGPVTDKIEDLIFDGVSDPDRDAKNWDLEQDPQIRIYWQNEEQQTQLVIYISHILTDGAGSKQLLYLLAKAYSGGAKAVSTIVNHQATDWLLQLVKQRQHTGSKRIDHPQAPLKLPKIKAVGPVNLRVGRVTLTAGETQSLIDATHAAGVTVNDVVMTAFGRVMQRFAGVPSIALACPTDMRKFGHPQPGYTQIANLTSRYNLSIDTPLSEPFTDLVKRVHQSMDQHKQHRQCFDSITDLLQNYGTKPLDQLQQVVQDNYHVREIAYTNFGIIDAKRLSFGEVPIKQVLMTGGFRQAPMFQIAAGTFNNKLALAFNMEGNEQEFTFGMALAHNTADLVNNFALSFSK